MPAQQAAFPMHAATVQRVATAEAHVRDRPWAFAEQTAAAIDAHWQRRTAEQPKLFNGDVLMVEAWSVTQGRFHATCFQTDFKSFLYWREHDAPDRTVFDFCPTGALHSAEGWLILGRASPAMSNAGQIYPFCGSLHAGDDRCGSIDLDGAMLREIEEETGLAFGRADLGEALLIDTGPVITLLRPIADARPALEIVRGIEQFLAQSPEPELSGAVIVEGVQDIDEALMPPFVSAYIRHAFR
jgi:8-oxo-dGTP pyrophosphatase MutT (NUDIX family)